MLRIFFIVLVLGSLTPLQSASADIEGMDELPLEEFQDDEVIGVKPVKPMPPYIPIRKADLTVTSVSAPIRVGANFVVNVVIRNLNRSPTLAPFYLLLHNNTTGTGPGAKQVGPLAPFQAMTVPITISAPDEQNVCSLSAIVDYGNRINEANEQNNVGKYYGWW